MNSPAIFAERRKHSREGVMGELENITYSIMRKHGAFSESHADAPIVEPITE